LVFGVLGLVQGEMVLVFEFFELELVNAVVVRDFTEGVEVARWVYEFLEEF
jgi:hypothetical protein